MAGGRSGFATALAARLPPPLLPASDPLQVFVYNFTGAPAGSLSTVGDVAFGKTTTSYSVYGAGFGPNLAVDGLVGETS